MAYQITQPLMDFLKSRKVLKIHYGATTLQVGSTIKTSGELELTLEIGYFFDESNPPKILNTFGMDNTTPYLREDNRVVILVTANMAADDEWVLPLTVPLGNSYTYPNNTPDSELEPPVVTEIPYTITSGDISHFNSKNVILSVGKPTPQNDVVVGSEIFQGDTLELRPKTDFEMVSAKVYYDIYSEIAVFKVAPDKQKATFLIPTITGNISLEDWQIATKSTVIEPPVFQGYTYTQIDKTTIENAKGQLFINGVAAVLGSTFIAGDVVEIRPLTGFGIVSASLSKSVYTKTFDITENKAIATMDVWDVDWAGWDLGDPIDNSHLVGATFDYIEFESVTPIPPDVEPTKGYNNVYLVDDENMKALSTKNFEVYFGSPDSPEIINYSKYITGLINLPFKIDPELIRQTGREIKLKDRSFHVNGDLLFTDVIRYDLGIIKVLPNENNFLDYDGVSCFIHLPYCDSFNIDIDYVIGYDIGVIYDINLYDGMANINITSSKIDGVIESKRVNLGITVPFGKLVDIPNNNDPKNVDLGGKNDVSTPYIEILKNDAVLPYGFFTTPISDETLLIEQNGFVKIDEIDLKVKASKDEKEMILNAMNEGVIIQ